MKNRIEVRIAGYGGQGVVLAGQILGKAAVYDGKNALQTQSYGAEARGSAARSEVIISDGKINFPAVRKCDILVAMNHESLNKHLEALKENGILIVDSTYVKEIPETKAKVYKVPATETAQKTFGASLYANMVMLGALAKITNLVSVEALEKAIKESVPPKNVETNITALKKGLQF
ncbi:MAG TPA: 2-oxoacid:ferredoxin oxidoreductase subunit gamma [Candidatus Bathyarchaeota archaeon]|nr:2-oxoacid:ferredoxin oxidoreductase subunit gamma [Candidatus Bathyarchaeota archaeon]